jgi:YebC/PmpR family DNA-binding regulatory protein
MSGHSKWSTIKHKKAAKDARRGKVFTKLIKEITVAARMGGGDPGGNPRLRAALLEARANSVPGDNIDRAIKKGTGELEGSALEEVVYEGYGPGGVAVLVETVTDNRNRTVSEIRHLFTKHGGNLAETGAVGWIFKKRGYFAVERGTMDEEAFMELALELGADDMATDDEAYEIFTSVEDFNRVRDDLERRGVTLAAKELAMVPQSYVELRDHKANQTLRLMEALEDHDDVQKVWANFDVDAGVLAAHAG